MYIVKLCSRKVILYSISNSTVVKTCLQQSLVESKYEEQSGWTVTSGDLYSWWMDYVIKKNDKTMVMSISTIRVNMILRINIHRTNKYIQGPHYHIHNCRWSARMEGRKHAKMIIIKNTSHSQFLLKWLPAGSAKKASSCPVLNSTLQTLCAKLCINYEASECTQFLNLDITFETFYQDHMLVDV